MITGGATGKVLKMAFPANLARWKAQSLKFSSGPAFLSILKLAYFWHFYIGKKKSLTLGSEIMCHVTLRVMKKIILSSSTVEFFHGLVSPGFEPGTSCILIERATPRPMSKGKIDEKLLHIKSRISSIQVFLCGIPFAWWSRGRAFGKGVRCPGVLGSNPSETWA